MTMLKFRVYPRGLKFMTSHEAQEYYHAGYMLTLRGNYRTAITEHTKNTEE